MVFFNFAECTRVYSITYAHGLCFDVFSFDLLTVAFIFYGYCNGNGCQWSYPTKTGKCMTCIHKDWYHNHTKIIPNLNRLHAFYHVLYLHILVIILQKPTADTPLVVRDMECGRGVPSLDGLDDVMAWENVLHITGPSCRYPPLTKGFSHQNGLCNVAMCYYAV